MGRVIRKGVEALVKEDLSIWIAERMLEKKIELKEKVNRLAAEITDECGELREEEEALKCFLKHIERARREVEKEVVP